MTQEITCALCGKQVKIETNYIRKRKYCSRECCKEAQRQKDLQKWKQRAILSEPLAPMKFCARCKWSSVLRENLYVCAYAEKNEHTRNFLHPEGLTAECMEFEPRSKKKDECPWRGTRKTTTL